MRQRLMDPELFRAFVQEFAREFNRFRAAEGNAVERSKSELAAIERRLRKIVDAIADGAPARTLKDELSTLEARQDELRAFLARPEPDRTLVHPGLAEIYRRKVAALHEALQDEATRDGAMELIRSLIEAIVLIPEQGSLKVEVRGELAAILAYGEDRKKPGRTDRALAKQIKMVAGGIGFEPTTFRLWSQAAPPLERMSVRPTCPESERSWSLWLIRRSRSKLPCTVNLVSRAQNRYFVPVAERALPFIVGG
jgi:hypothetical protein